MKAIDLHRILTIPKQEIQNIFKLFTALNLKSIGKYCKFVFESASN